MSLPNSYMHVKKKKKGSFVNCIMLVVLIGLILIAVGYIGFKFWYSNGVNRANSDSTEVVTLEIPSGSSSSEIGELLKEKDLIKDKLLWDIYIKINKPNLLADKYKLPKNLSIKQIVETLERPAERKIIWVTFPEGITMKKMGEILQEKQSDFTEDRFFVAEFVAITEEPDEYEFSEDIATFLTEYKPEGKPLEGFLYPETYSFEEDYSAKDIIEVMLREFIKQTKDLDLKNGKYNFYEALTLASIVERESNGDEDRPYIASVFSNRLQDGWLLRSDATVNYATGKSEMRPSEEDINIASPYNTYKYTGLPPTPICNPRLASLKEALNPIETEYYFFIHEEDGTAHFGKNEDEHFHNVCKYLDKTCN